MKLCLPKGTKDILPDQIHLWQKAERVFAEVCAQYGFSEIRIPTFEHTDVFERGVGNATDVVRKEMYTFEDKGGRSITLRPEGTAGVVRSFIVQMILINVWFLKILFTCCFIPPPLLYPTPCLLPGSGIWALWSGRRP